MTALIDFPSSAVETTYVELVPTTLQLFPSFDVCQL